MIVTAVSRTTPRRSASVRPGVELDITALRTAVRGEGNHIFAIVPDAANEASRLGFWAPAGASLTMVVQRSLGVG
jgi:hypothetical protein